MPLLAWAHAAFGNFKTWGGMAAIQKIVPKIPVTAIFKKTELDALRAQEHGDG